MSLKCYGRFFLQARIDEAAPTGRGRPREQRPSGQNDMLVRLCLDATLCMGGTAT
ncbi:hypothetical protein [Burkholderia sp. TSV86]|uniref:hypothetical protein n=1 Tax=Burkholderia sp. TSV86 TaxID=1385594 RepID=UPI000AAF8788|nr:hypothetical protein [Burkholderia sp. TSV86]